METLNVIGTGEPEDDAGRWSNGHIPEFRGKLFQSRDGIHGSAGELAMNGEC